MAATERTNGAAQNAQPTPAAQANGHAPAATHEPIFREPANLDYLRLHVQALQRVLMRKGLVTYAEVLQEVHQLEETDHRLGQEVVARAWTDAAFKQRLLQDGKAACSELGIEMGGYEDLKVLENTDTVHHVVVCTTCSCVPSPLHGITPDWYKSAAYRSRVPNEPRAVLREFGLELPDNVEVRVVDTDVKHRAMVLPKRPPLSDHLGPDELAPLVTQESLFGVGLPNGPVGA